MQVAQATRLKQREGANVGRRRAVADLPVANQLLQAAAEGTFGVRRGAGEPSGPGRGWWRSQRVGRVRSWASPRRRRAPAPGRRTTRRGSRCRADHASGGAPTALASAGWCSCTPSTQRYPAPCRGV